MGIVLSGVLVTWILEPEGPYAKIEHAKRAHAAGVAMLCLISRKIKISFLMRRSRLRRYWCRGHSVLLVGTGGWSNDSREDCA